jgi:putative endonuclease
MIGPDRRTRGKAAEAMARAYLVLKGFHIIGTNIRDGPRELDIVAERDGVVVFVEVKFRSDDRFGGFRMALNPTQRADLERAAVTFLKSSGRVGVPVRFDMVGIEFEEPNGLRLVHLPEAYASSGRFHM